MKAGIFQKVICGAAVALAVSSTLAETNADAKHYGFWLFSRDMRVVDLDALKALGTTDLLLHDQAIASYGQPAVEAWIAKANEAGIKVHIWVQAFYNGKWTNPARKGAPKLALFGRILAHSKQCARIRGVGGIHYDYLRCGGKAYNNTGATEAITKFAKLAVQHLHQVNPDLIVSAALMPETTETAYYYGQDYPELSRHLDVVIPMIYKGNFHAESPWISKTAKWYIKHSKGAKVWVGLQGYRAAKDVTLLPPEEMKADVDAALETGADGVIVFRWGLTSLVKPGGVDASPTGSFASAEKQKSGETKK